MLNGFSFSLCTDLNKFVNFLEVIEYRVGPRERGAQSMAIMDENNCWWSSIPASKRASHVIIIGFLCVSLAAGLSDGGEIKSRRDHADTRPHQQQKHQQLQTVSATLRDAENSASTIILSNLFELKHNSHVDSKVKSNSSNSNNIMSDNTTHATDNSALSLSLLTSSVLSRLNSSPSSGSNRGERLPGTLPGRGQMSRVSSPHHHLRAASQADASASRRVRRKASNRGNPFIYKPKSPIQLFCRTGYRLAVHEDRTINGTKDNTDVYSSLYIQSKTRSFVSIQGIHSGLYVCVDEDGHLYGHDRAERRDCLFQESIEPNFFNTYGFTMPGSSSRRHRTKTRYLSINKDGVARIAKVRSQKKAQFIPLTPPKKLL